MKCTSTNILPVTAPELKLAPLLGSKTVNIENLSICSWPFGTEFGMFDRLIITKTLQI